MSDSSVTVLGMGHILHFLNFIILETAAFRHGTSFGIAQTDKCSTSWKISLWNLLSSYNLLENINFSFLKKKKVTASTLCPLSSFSVPVSTIICLFSENPVKFVITFISLELKKKLWITAINVHFIARQCCWVPWFKVIIFVKTDFKQNGPL